MPSEQQPAEQEPFVSSDEDVNVMLELCDDQPREVIRILIAANVKLQEELDRLRSLAVEVASHGYIRSRPTPKRVGR